MVSLPKKIILAFLTGVLGCLCFPTVFFSFKFPDLSFLSWFYLVPLFIAVYRSKPIHAFLISFFSMLIFYYLNMYWFTGAIVEFGNLSTLVALFVCLLICIIFAFIFAFFLALAKWVYLKTELPYFILLSIFLIASDYLRTYFPVGGFTWAMPAYAQANTLSYFQWVDLTGVLGLNLYIFLINALIADLLLVFIGQLKRDRAVSRASILLILLISSFLLSSYRESHFQKNFKAEEGFSAAIIQGNIDSKTKWDPQRAQKNLQKYLHLTEEAKRHGVDLAIWPETAYPYSVRLNQLEHTRFVNQDLLPLPLLTGVVSRQLRPEVTNHNSAFLINENQSVSSIYHKRHLVPFGEYIPLKDYLGFAKDLTKAVGNFSPGKKDDLMHFNQARLGNLICYEDIFPDLARESVMAGANVLLNITNDSWYGDTSAQHQHLVFSQMRALENRRYLIRSTNTGVSAFIDPRGEVLKTMPSFKEGILIDQVRLISEKTFYSKKGDWVAYFCILFSSLSFLYALMKKKKSLEPL